MLNTIKEVSKMFIMILVSVLCFTMGSYLKEGGSSFELPKLSFSSSKAVEKVSSVNTLDEVDGASKAIKSTEIAKLSFHTSNEQTYTMATVDPSKDDYSLVVPFESNPELANYEYAVISFHEDGSTSLAPLYRANDSQRFEMSSSDLQKTFEIVALLQTLNPLESDEVL